MENVKKNYIYLKFIFFVRYFADSMFYGFTALFLSSIGLKEGIIGNIASITTITTMIVNPIWSYLAKNNKVSRLLLIILSIIEGTLITIYGHLDTVSIIMVFTSLMAIAAGPYYNILDGYAVTFCKINNKEYAAVRVMGSLGYVCGIPLAGTLVQYIGYRNVFLIAGCLFIVVGFLNMFLKKLKFSNTEEEPKRDYRKIIKNKWFIFYLLIYMLTVILSNIGDGYQSLFFKSVKGLTDTQYSYVYTIVLLVEVFTMLLLAKFGQNIKIIYLMLIAGVLYFLKFFLLSFTALPVWVLIFAAGLRGLSWGMVLFYHMKYMLKLVGIENITTAAIVFSVATSLFQFGVNNIAGYLIEDFGYSIVYRSLAIIMIFGTSLNLCVALLQSKKNIS